MFGKFFNIDESAFSIAPNPKYLYLSPQHEEALAHLVYGVSRKGGFVCLTGDIGTGKTTICRCMFEQLPENTDIAFVINPKFRPLELLASICDELSISYSTFNPSIKEYVKKIFDYLIESHAKGRSTVLVIDEAQNLSIDTIEHIRALTNIETNEQKLLQIILIGQPELRDMLVSPDFEQVNQRITARFHIGPLSLRESSTYINHRLAIAGAKTPIFTAKNIKHIYKYTRGVPRLINILCDRVLLGASVMHTYKISASIIKQSANEIFPVHKADKFNFTKAIAASIAALFVSGALVFAYQTKISDTQNISQKAALEQPVVSDIFTVDIEDKKEKEIALLQLDDAQINQAEPLRDSFQAVLEDNETDAQLQQEAQVQVGPNQVAISQTLTSQTKSFVNTETQLVEKAKSSSKYNIAYTDLFRLWGVDYSDNKKDPCEYALEHQLHCYKQKGSIEAIAHLNRPAILKSKNDGVESNYLVLVTLEGEQAIVSENGEYQAVGLNDIESNWNGEYEILWRPLQAGLSHVAPGHTSEVIAELDVKLANLAGRKPKSPAPLVYSESLINQVKAFQVAQNIVADGILGPVTQIHINSTQESDIPLLLK